MGVFGRLGSVWGTNVWGEGTPEPPSITRVVVAASNYAANVTEPQTLTVTATNYAAKVADQ
jgi:hypothetical protein